MISRYLWEYPGISLDLVNAIYYIILNVTYTRAIKALKIIIIRIIIINYSNYSNLTIEAVKFAAKIAHTILSSASPSPTFTTGTKIL